MTEGKKIKIPEEISGLMHRYNDELLADDSLSDMDVLLLAIYLIEYTNKKSGVKYSECKEIFTSLGRNDRAFGVYIQRAKKNNLIKDKDKNLFFLIKGLKTIREKLGQVEKAPVQIIKSGENFTAIKLFEEFLINNLGGEEILLCDSHVSPSTLFPFSVLREEIKSIKILTSNIFDSEKFKDYQKKMKKEMGIDIEIKINQKIHDRYLICKNNCWHIGTSIKDLGNKDSIIKDISEVLDSMKSLFNERWLEKTKPQ